LLPPRGVTLARWRKVQQDLSTIHMISESESDSESQDSPSFSSA